MVRFIFAFSLSLVTFRASADIHLNKIHLPSGFKIEVFASKISGARSMAWGPNGVLFVGSKEAGNVYAILPNKEVIKIARNLNFPNGVAFRDGDLYVAEVSRLLRFKDIEKNLKNNPKPEVLLSNYPKDLHHGWKFIAFGPDGKLYIPVGAPCNICDPKEPYASITRVDSDGSNREIFARGVRNTVGFDWHPETHELWFTDNGRDLMGDDIPSDELNHAPKSGLHFGYPFCHQGDTLDPEFGKDKKCSDYVPPDQKLGPHVAALGMRFYTGTMFPSEYKNQIFIAEHGSWNRSHKIGYRLALVRMSDDHHAKSTEVFADGWLQKETAWGRPVDVILAPDGALLVSDDMANAIYRISYAKP